MRRRGRLFAALILTGLGVFLMFGLFGCRGKQYRVDYSGQKDLYEGARDSYRAGEQVTLYYPMIATDTDYSFCLDGEFLNPDYSEDRGFILRFTMPDHDAVLQCLSRNTMEYVPEPEAALPPDTMLIDCYSATAATVGGDGYRELVLYTTDGADLKLTVYEKESEDREEREISYLVPREAADLCYSLIRAHDLRSWNELEDAEGITGAVSVCKFWDDGEYVRVSTEQMPGDGKEILREISDVLESYAREEYRMD